MKTNWPTKKIGEVLEKNGVIPAKIKCDDYRQSGKYPIVDQGENLIAGYIDDEQKLYRGDLPVIIFGDHTRILKYIDFPFAFGADGIKILRPQEILLPKFFYYTLILNPVANQGYKRHFSLLTHTKISLPPLATQKQIVERLDKIAEAQKLNDGLIQKIDELFQSLLHKELNPIRDNRHSNGVNSAGPADAKAMAGKKDWEVKELGILCDVRDGTHASPKFFPDGLPLITSKNLIGGVIDFSNIQFISEKDYLEIEKRSKVDDGDILFGMIGTIGNPVIVHKNRKFSIKNVGLIKFTAASPINSFVYYALLSSFVGQQIKKFSRGGTQKFVSLGNLRNLKIYLPDKNTQKQIISKLSAVQDYKKQLLGQKSNLKELFDSVLHKLMK